MAPGGQAMYVTKKMFTAIKYVLNELNLSLKEIEISVILVAQRAG